MTRHELVFLVACGLLSAASCRGEPSTVYVPGGSFAEELHLATPSGSRARVRLGEPLVLHAMRRSGPWRGVPAESLEAGSCSLASPPRELEPEVAGSVRWIVEPEGHATFNVDLRQDGSREVRFDAPGRYRVTAESSSRCGEPFPGDTLLIEVVEQR